jgi:4'-phosphopantetheinyl transferase
MNPMLADQLHSSITNNFPPDNTCHPNICDYSLYEDYVEIWKINLCQLIKEEYIRDSLSEDEKKRSEKLLNDDKRRKFLASRFALRTIISRYTGASEKDVRFNYSEEGKPYLDTLLSDRDIEFNLSHSGNFMIIALSKSLPVGIDLEMIVSMHAKGQIISQYFSSGDAVFYQRLPVYQRQCIFYQLWTLKESFSKAHGMGFSLSPNRNFAHLIQQPNLDTTKLTFVFDAGFWFTSFFPGNGFIASLAIKSAKRPRAKLYDFEITN